MAVFRQVPIGIEGPESLILDSSAHGEVVEALPGVVLDAEDPMNLVVVEAADASGRIRAASASR